MEDSDCPLFNSSLICHEDKAFSIDGEQTELLQLQPYTSLHSDAEEQQHIEILASREDYIERRNHEIPQCKWLRFDAIQWILKMKECFGFSNQTVYLAVSYFDRFLLRRSIDNKKSWVVQLLSLACLSVAAKMEEVVAPTVVDYQTEQCCFDAITIQRMELLVLSTLEWRMSSATPLAYLNYFTNKFNGNSLAGEWLSKPIEFIFAVLNEINLAEYRASAIAAAAVLAAFDQKLTRQALESKMKSASAGLLDTELVHSCYSLMTRGSKERSMNSLASSDQMSSTVDNSVDVSDCASLAGNSNKRRRLQESHND